LQMNFWKQVSVLAGGTAAAHAVTLAALPAITRLFSPEEYGAFAVLMAILAMWSTLLTLRYESALFVAETDRDTRDLLTLCRILTIAMSLLAIPFLAGLAAFRLADLSSLPWPALAASIAFLVASGLFQARRAFDIREAKLAAVRSATIGRSLGSALIKIAAGLLGFGASGLILAEAIAAWIGVWLLDRRSAVNDRSPTHRAQLRTVARKYPKYPTVELPSTLIDSAGALLVLPVYAHMFGLKEAAFLGLAQRVVALPNTHIGRAIADVAQREMAEKLRANAPGEIQLLLRSLVGRLAALGVVPLVAVMTLAPALFGLIFGAQWQASGTVAAIIAPWLYAAFVVSTVSRILLVVQKQEYKLAYDVAAITLVLGVLVATRWLNLTFLQSVACLSAGRVFTYGVYLLVIFRATRSFAADERSR
jgi:O-antigen/teichoic acid export membrane protein